MNKEVKVCSKVARGQVWMINGDNESYKTGSVGSVTSKTRPYVIVSCKENNLHSTTFNALAISTGSDDFYPMHVFYRYAGRPQNIQCEQIKTFDVIDLKEYMYTLGDDIMDKVDTALANQLGLSLRAPSYDRLVETIEKIAKAKAFELTAKQKKVTDENIQDIASRLETIFNVEESTDEVTKKIMDANPVEFKAQNSTVSVASSRTDDSKKCVVKTDSLNKSKPTREYSESKRTPISQIPAGTGRNKWTEENKKKFLEDCEKYGPETVAQMWGLKDKKAVYSYKYMFKGAD